MQIVRASLAYWALIFGLGFALGTLRAVWLAEALGESLVILLEIPLMLAASWWAARWCMRRYAIATSGEALSMGALAFALLMAAELALTSALPGETPGEWIAGLVQVPGVFGFAGQVAFALMPWMIAQFSTGGRSPRR